MGHGFVRYAWLLVFLTSVPLSAQERSALPGLTIPDGFGVNIHFTRAEPGELEAIKNGGNRFVRMDLTWQGVEREKGKYDFSRYDQLVADARRLNIRILFILDYAHRLYDGGFSPHSEDGRHAFARFAAAAAKRYAGKNILWEIWNEPNIRQFWKPRPNAEDYCKLAHATIDAIREADPKAFIVGPASSTFPWEFFEVMGRQGLFKKLDAVSVHPYRQTHPETAEQDYARLRLLLHEYVPERRLPILSGEWGYSTAWRGMTEEKQAQYIVRQRLMNLACDVPLSIWYDWRDDGLDPKEPEHHFGMVYRDFKPKPSYRAAQELAERLQGYRYVRRVAARDERDWVLLFRGRHGGAVVSWTTGEPHGATVRGATPAFTNAPVVKYVHEEATRWRPTEGVHVYRPGMPDAIELEFDAFVPGYRGRVMMRLDGRIVYEASLKWPEEPSARHRIPFTLHRRDGGGVTAVVHVDGPTVMSSTMPAQVKLLCAEPLHMAILPPIGRRAAIFVENPSGAPIDTTVRLSAPGVVTSEGLHLDRGQTRATVRFELPQPIGEASPIIAKARAPDDTTIFEVKSGGWRRTTRLESGGGWRAVLEGNDAVAANARWFFHPFDSPPPQPGLTRQIELIYQFADGWRFATLRPPKELAAIEGKPKVLGMWVRGDGGGNVLRCRFTDSTGQTFQPDYGPIDWTGWKWVTMKLDGASGGHWGGADDGVVHYPIQWDSVALVDNGNLKVNQSLSLRFAGFAVEYE